MDISLNDVIHKAVGEYKRSGNVDLVKLIDELGVPVYIKDLADSDTVADLVFNEDEDTYEIEINNNEKNDPKLIRTKVAMEFAKLAKEGAQISSETELFNIASSILLPEELVSDFIQEKGVNKESGTIFDDSVVDELCNKFDVPRTVATLRLKELGYLG